MSAPALIFALALMAADAPASAPQGEPLPAGAPTEDYPLTAWCYGAMSEYLAVYDRVKPDLKAIDKMFGSSVPHEAEPYSSDMAAARVELKVLADAVVAAEKASPNPIAAQGGYAVKQGRSVWAPAEAKTSRELARAWLSWALPDRCDSTARTLASKSALLGQALKYNSPEPTDSATASTPLDPQPPATSTAEPAPPAQTPTTEAPSPTSPAAAVGSSTTPSVDSILSDPPPSQASTPPSQATDAPPAVPTPGADASPNTDSPPAQIDPNAPIPDPTPPRP